MLLKLIPRQLEGGVWVRYSLNEAHSVDQMMVFAPFLLPMGNIWAVT
jgi:hypothetical protein